jgi:acetate kinase
MKPVVVVNAGSTSLKVSLLEDESTVAAALELDPWDGSPDQSELADFLSGIGNDVAIGHRIVHGGSQFTGPVLVGQSVVDAIRRLTDLAPLHQPRALAGIEAARRALPSVPAVACFDTAFHAGLPAPAARYALPATWTSQFGLRRYGFHGLSHAYASRRAAALIGQDVASQRIVTCHLGGGASLAAVDSGRSVDTTMGFTPLEGLVMATRSGSVDPGLLMWLLQHTELGIDDVARGLEEQSGLAGLAGLSDGSGDMRAVRAASQSGSADASLAIAVYVHRLRREIAAMAAAMDGLDVLVFTGGIGEHAPWLRAAAADGLGFLGVHVDPGRNEVAADAEIGDPAAAVRVLVVTAREDVEVARQTRLTIAVM